MTDDNKKGLIEGLSMHPLHVSIVKNEIVPSAGIANNFIIMETIKGDPFFPINKMIDTYVVKDLHINQSIFPERSGLVAYYNASSFNGTVWKDLSGHGNTMQIYGSAKDNVVRIDNDAVRFVPNSRGMCPIIGEPQTIYVMARNITDGYSGYSMMANKGRSKRAYRTYTDFCPTFYYGGCAVNTDDFDLNSGISGRNSYHVVCVTRSKKSEVIDNDIKYYGDLYLYVDGALMAKSEANTYADSRCRYGDYINKFFINARKGEYDPITNPAQYNDDETDSNFYSYTGINDYKAIAFCSTQHTDEQVKKNSEFLSILYGTCSGLGG